MNIRQKKKRDKKLYKAIYELNKMIAEDYEVEFVEDGLLETLNHVKSNPSFIKGTFRDYKRYILNR